MWTEKAVLKEVRKCIADVVEVNIREVKPDAKLIRDLGAESVDLLDIVFRLERLFDIRIPRSGIERQAKRKVKQWIRAGVLTDEALEILRTHMPEVDPAEFRSGMRPKDIPTLFTVQTFLNLVIQRLEETGDYEGETRH